MKISELRQGVYKVRINKGQPLIRPDKSKPKPTQGAGGESQVPT